MTAIPKCWTEFGKDGTAIRRTGYLNGTWMDPEDAKPRRARVYDIHDNELRMAWVGRRIEECGVVWHGRVRICDKMVHGLIVVGVGGYEFILEDGPLGV